MGSNKNNLSELTKSILLGIGLFVLASLILSGDKILLKFSNHHFFKIKDNHYASLDVKNLSPGGYLLSFGRVRGPCHLLGDGKPLGGTHLGGLETRYPLGFSYFIEVGKNVSQRVEVKCDRIGGFQGGIKTHKPVAVDPKWGPVIQLYRELVVIYLGPMGSIFLILAMLAFLSGLDDDIGRKSIWNEPKKRSILFFTIVSFLYSTSLAHFPRLILTGWHATNLHIFLRITFSFAFVITLGTNSRLLKSSLIPYALLFPAYFAIVLFNNPMVLKFYKTIYPLFIITTAIASIPLFFDRRFTNNKLPYKVIALMWVIGQFSDLLTFYALKGLYNGPLMVVFLGFGMLFAIKRDVYISERLKRGVGSLVDAMASDKDLKETFKELALINHNLLGFKRISAYLDLYATGENKKKGLGAKRIYEEGYDKDTDQDGVIIFNEDRGQKMLNATKSGEPLIDQGSDGGYYLIFPIGDLAWINLSNDKNVGWFDIGIKHELAQKLKYINQSFSQKIIEYTAHGGEAVSMVKAKWGEGKWNIKLGSIFADIVDYSYYNKKYEGNKFSSFVDEVFLPALIKQLNPHALPERFGGDEVYFIILDWDGKNNLEKILINSTRKILSFLNNEGPAICQSHGFEPLQMTIGANVGEAVLTCDKYSLRSAGDSVNLAARLMKLCPKGKAMMPDRITNSLASDGLRVVSKRSFMAKKDFIDGAIIELNRTDEDAA